MSVIIDGTNGISTPNTFAFKNRLIDAGFIVNQRTYTSGTALSSGSYGHDRWKAGSGGGTYTFTQGSTGVPITITITAGTLQQVIEGSNVSEGGTYTLSWTGTATARINSGSYAASPITVTGQTAGANMTIEFATGTVLTPQLETGSIATSFDYRPYGTEFNYCQRYYQVFGGSVGVYLGNGLMRDANNSDNYIKAWQVMRSQPTVTGTNTSNAFGIFTNGDTGGTFNGTVYGNQNQGALVRFAPASSLTSGQACIVSNTVGAYIAFSAEL